MNAPRRYNPAMNAPTDPQLESLKVPPHSIEAEQSVLGGLLLDNAAWIASPTSSTNSISTATTTG